MSPLFQTITTETVSPGFCMFGAWIPQSCVVEDNRINFLKGRLKQPGVVIGRIKVLVNYNDAITTKI